VTSPISQKRHSLFESICCKLLAMASWADDEPDPVPVAAPVSYRVASGAAPVPSHQASQPPAPPRAGGPAPGGSSGPLGGGRVPKAVPQQGPWILFVGNLADGLTEDDIRQEFKDCQPMAVRLLRHRDSDRLRGCFIEVPSAEALTAGLAHEGTPLRGRPLHTDVGDAPRNDRGAFVFGAHAWGPLWGAQSLLGRPELASRLTW
jgi:hypothetical protein